jgi:TonB family protein
MISRESKQDEDEDEKVTTVYQSQIFVSSEPVPRRSVIVLSVFAHLVVLASVVVFRPTVIVTKLPEQYAVQKLSEAAHLSFSAANAKPAQPLVSPSRVPRSTRQARVPDSGTAADAAGIEVLREHAKQATAGLMTSIKLRQIYGFDPDNFELPIRTVGEVPDIPAADVPPRFQQYVIVEITIDVDGRVADARIVSGLVNPTIQQTLLSAIRDFKYIPAKRGGTPIPSQVDIVVHVPT